MLIDIKLLSSMDTQNHGNKEMSIIITCERVIRKELVDN